ncbi:hypothetical protein KY285_023945 [Solanum tuberosum]|nr:hypothetical protein KY289_024293 [Solanum tuberosum]KAH0676144.1 hypothetical protein KY285_023945 [Solanum tuberosum]
MENNIWLNLKMAIKLAFPTFEMVDSWKNFSETVEHLRQTTEWKIIKWIKPTTGKVKLNTDRSFSKHEAGIGGIFRNEYGNMIMAFAAKWTVTSITKKRQKRLSMG